jgi:subtilisin family serine protease
MPYAGRAFIIIVLMSMAVLGAVQAAEAPEWKEKVHPLVLEHVAVGPTEFIVVLSEQADLSPVAALDTKQERGARVFEILTDVAERTQAPLVALLESRGVEFRPFWIANMIWVRGDVDDLALLADDAAVLRVDANPSVRLEEPLPVDDDDTPTPTSIEWGVLKVQAEQVWALGYRGEGIVIGGQDTGYEWNHPALIDHYRGWDGVSANHDYNWHDAIHSGGGSCGADSPVPCDDHDHGTHTMGTMVGDDGGSNQIGMSPASKWIGCRNMNQGNGTPATYSECFQWFVAPTDVAGNNPDPSKAPHVINNSWTCPPSEGCSHDTLKTVVENTRAAGIVVVVSAGNAGNSCSSVSTPPAIYEASLSVGATDSSDNIASFSSRGPVTVDGSNRLKPEVSAPGVSVRSSVRGGGYAFFSGTSMAGPHVAGQIGLLLDARPDLIGQVDDIETIVKMTATPRTSSQDCGGFDGGEIPNPVYGYGRIDALEAVVGDADGDGVDNLTDCAPADPGVWGPPGPATDLSVSNHPILTAISWSGADIPGGLPEHFDVLRSTLADDFSAPVCLATATAQQSVPDPDVPESEGVFYYLVRTTNDCGTDLGTMSTEAPRSGGACP